MYHILIVDDSVLDIDCITFLIRKYDLPLCPVTAVNGQDALAMIQKKEIHFDILFTDIKMPFMDGLTLSKKVHMISPDTKIIIFSGFNDFEYAKTAITIGVENYLMKPIIPSDFEATMRKVIHSLETQHHQKEQQEIQANIVKSHILWQALHNTSLPKQMADFLVPYHNLMLIECDNEFFSNTNDEFQKKLEKLLPMSFDYLNLYPSRSLLFIKKPLKDTLILDAAQTICLFTNNDYEQKCYITFDEIPDNTQIARVYSTLEKRIESRFFFPERNILPPSDSIHTYISSGHISMDILADDLKQQDYDTFDAHLEEIFDSLKNDQTPSLIYVKYCFTEMVKLLCQTDGNSDLNLNHMAETIYSSSNILELMELVRSLSAAARKNAGTIEKRTPKTEKIRQYIYQNYTQTLTLEEIAAHFYLSSNYLCSIFKKENGCSLIKFINDYRLKRAAELLVTTQLKINAVSDAVGFNNSSYFIQRFRDYYGETPDSYRQNHSRPLLHTRKEKA